MTYANDRRWSDAFIPEIKRIIGPFLLETSSFEVDTKQATDLVVLRARDVNIACRVRRYGYADIYPFQFTIRAKRDSKARTELEKIVDGWGDWMFYGHANQDDTSIERWWIIDLHAWRAAMIRDRVRGESRSNNDGTHFVAYDVRSFPTGDGRKRLVVGSSHMFEPLIAQMSVLEMPETREWLADFEKAELEIHP